MLSDVLVVLFCINNTLHTAIAIVGTCKFVRFAHIILHTTIQSPGANTSFLSQSNRVPILAQGFFCQQSGLPIKCKQLFKPKFNTYVSKVLSNVIHYLV